MRESLVGGVSAGIVAALVAVSVATAAPKKPAAKAAPEPTAAQIAAGKKVFETSCQVCHKVAGKGGTSGPDLTKIGKEHDAPWLTKKLKDPKFNNKGSIMPVFAGSAQQLKTVIAYMVSLK